MNKEMLNTAMKFGRARLKWLAILESVCSFGSDVKIISLLRLILIGRFNMNARFHLTFLLI